MTDLAKGRVAGSNPVVRSTPLHHKGFILSWGLGRPDRTPVAHHLGPKTTVVHHPGKAFPMPQTPAHPVLCDFLDDMGYAPSTTRSVTSNLCIFERWATAHELDILSVTHHELQSFLDQRGVGPSALHKAWQVLDTLYGW